uniref:Uncharacterized protein n=1 Tax=Nelumbo nucifera TaxID=4432 RepID=A0A822XT68_NELNU|nr:TPA_asm: hypothetical protein HUJ06_024366 [Nelumbo nucifera]
MLFSCELLLFDFIPQSKSALISWDALGFCSGLRISTCVHVHAVLISGFPHYDTRFFVFFSMLKTLERYQKCSYSALETSQPAKET